MELIDNLDEKFWRRGNPDKKEGYQEFRIIKAYDKGGYFEYAVFDNDGGLQKVYGPVSSYDPFRDICNVLLKLAEDGKSVTGIICEDECCVRIGSNAEVEEKENSGSGKQQKAKKDKSPPPATDDDGTIVVSKDPPHCPTCCCRIKDKGKKK